jgi:hypothetical protein
MATYTERIHEALTSAAESGAFHPVRFTGRDLAVDTNVTVAPSTVLVYEVSSSFGLPRVQRRDRMQERLAWEWLLVVEFNTAVACEEFEEALCASPILVPRSEGLRQITLRLLGSEYEHPARQQASKGTQVSFRFEAELSPI